MNFANTIFNLSKGKARIKELFLIIFASITHLNSTLKLISFFFFLFFLYIKLNKLDFYLMNKQIIYN